MAAEIKDKFSASTALAITLAGLASSTVGLGRQSDIVDNTAARYQRILLYVKLRLGTSPTSARSAQVYLIRDDNHGTNHRTDNAGTADAAFTVLNAQLVGIINNKSSGAATGDYIYGEFVIDNPGPKWGIAIVHDTGVTLDATAGNHWARYVGINPEVQ